MSWAQNYFGIQDLKRQLDRMERNQEDSVRRDIRLMGAMEENIAKLRTVSGNLDELAGDIEELKAMVGEDPTELNAAIDALVARTRQMADIVPEVVDPSDNPSA